MKIGQSATGTPPPGHHLAIPNRLYTASAPVRRDISPLVCHMFSPQCYLTSGHTLPVCVTHWPGEIPVWNACFITKDKTNTHVF